MNLPGGSVLNSALLSEEDAQMVSAHNATYKNFGLKAGIVTKVYDTDDESNLSKIGPEYDVLVIEQDADRSISAIQYKNCMMADTFGSIADFFEFRLREQTKEDGDDGRNPEKQNGAIVLMLCLDGASEKGIILKALKHPNRKEVLDKDKDLHMHGEFNGLNVKVDKDGAFKLTFKGPRDNDGEYAKSDKEAGTFLEIDKAGNVELNVNNEKETSVKVSKEDEKISTISEKETEITAGKDITAKSKETVTIDAGKDLAFAAGGKANIKAESKFDIESGGDLSMKAASLKATIDGQAQIQASQITLQGMTFLGSAGGTPAIIGTTQFLGVGNVGAPVISLAIGPFSSQVFIAP